MVGRLAADFCSGEVPPGKESARVWSALLGGGRRGGKTHFGGAVASATMMVAVGGALVWLVSKSIAKSAELDRGFRGGLARQWYTDRGAPWFEYTLLNGSMAFQKSSHDSEDVKQGGADLVFLNEAQKMSEDVLINARGSIVDTGGVVLLAANPPKTSRAMWVLDFHDAVLAGRRKAKYFHFDYRKNPFIEQEALTDLEDEADERTIAMEVRGEFLHPTDVVFYNWTRENELPLPEVGDITTRWMAEHHSLDVRRDPGRGLPEAALQRRGRAANHPQRGRSASAAALGRQRDPLPWP